MPTAPDGRRGRRFLATALAASVAASGLLAAPLAASAQPVAQPAALPAAPATVPGVEATPSDQKISSFTLGVLPDTQFYSRYATTEEGQQFQNRYGTEPFSSQTQWLVDNDDALGMPFVTHLGDIVDQVGIGNQWTVASNAMSILERGGLEYSILPGNHDVNNQNINDDQRSHGSEPYLQRFSQTRAATENAETFQGRDPLGYSEFHIFEKDGNKYLVLAVGWNASDATIAWAQSVLDAHPNLPTVLTSHQLLNISDDGVTPAETSFGLKMWNTLIAKNNQIFMTLNGHHHGNANWLKTNNAGNPVLQVVNDYQMAYQGGNGYLGLYEFDFTNNKIRASQVSPWVVTKSKVLVNQFDQAVLRKPNERYEVAFDLTGRFASINPEFRVSAADHTNYTDKAVEILYENYTEPISPEHNPPTGGDDYFHAENTVAHWQFDGTDGEAMPVGAVVKDVEGKNPLKRTRLINGAEVGDVTYSTSAHSLAANKGSICFANSDRDTKRLSFLSTDANTPLTNERFPNGYTIETFIKIDEKFTPEKNRWMTALAAGGTRVAGNPDGEAPPFFMGISNLVEVQWSVDPTNATAKTNWSGEILKGTWLHVAAVNDPGTQTTTLYIEGAPVLRNVTGGVAGIETILGTAWKMGASSDYGTPDAGFLGCIGETRIVSQPLSADQWLTSRAQAPSDQTNSTSAADGFDRHNGELGEGWADARGFWAVKGKDAIVADSVGQNVAAYTGTPLGDAYTVNSTVAVPTQNGNSQWVGTAVNVQGDSSAGLSYYALRVAPNWSNWDQNRWQLIKVTGSTTATVIRSGVFTANPTKPIDLSISRSLDSVTISVGDYLGQTAVRSTATLAEFPALRGGSAGLYSDAADLVASSFAVTTSSDAEVPGAPALVSASASAGSITAEWAEPSDIGGSAVSGYSAIVRAAVNVDGAVQPGEIVATRDVDAGSRSVTVADLAAGDYVVSISATNGVGTSAESPVSSLLTVAEVVTTQPPVDPTDPPVTPEDPERVDARVTVSTPAVRYGTAATAKVTVSATGAAPSGDVVVYVNGVEQATAALVGRTATVELPATLIVGAHGITAEYLGDDAVSPADGTSTLTVRRAVTAATVKVSRGTAKVGTTSVTATLTVTVPGTKVAPTGKVLVKVGGKTVKTVTLRASAKGKVTVTLPKFAKRGTAKITATLLSGTQLLGVTTKAATVTVTR